MIRQSLAQAFAVSKANQPDCQYDAGGRPTLRNYTGRAAFEQFAIRWTDKIRIAKDGKYTFSLESDDGWRLLIDGKQVVDNGGWHETQVDSGSVELKAGDHDLKMDYFENENDGGVGCILSWKPDGLLKEGVPEKVLFH